jgi:AmiR/NasT family two-component response regulator
VLERITLALTRDSLRSQLSSIRNDLATRRALQRAEGFLATRWGIDVSLARLWMLRRAEHTGASVLEMARQILDDHVERKGIVVGRRSREREFFRQYRVARAG